MTVTRLISLSIPYKHSIPWTLDDECQGVLQFEDQQQKTGLVLMVTISQNSDSQASMNIILGKFCELWPAYTHIF